MIEDVADIIREVSAGMIEPRFEALVEGDVRSKSPGEVVTVADEEAEALLRARLRDVVDAPVVGEEACATDPSLLGRLAAERVWLVDPLDGTANFVAGSQDWAVMVALVEQGEAVASWIWRPVDARMYVAERGSGASCNGVPLHREEASPAIDELRGAVLTGFLDDATASVVDTNRGRFGAIEAGSRCAGVDYPRVAEGDLDFVVFWRTLPWDHAPGALLVQEAGGTVKRPDGRAYRVVDDGPGLLAAAGDATWHLARTLLDP